MKIDFHVHMLDEHVFRACTNKTVYTGFGVTPVAAPRPGTEGLLSRIMSPEAVIEDMDARGIGAATTPSRTGSRRIPGGSSAAARCRCRT